MDPKAVDKFLEHDAFKTSIIVEDSDDDSYSSTMLECDIEEL